MPRYLTTEDIKKISELTEATSAAGSWMVSIDDGINPVYKITLTNLMKLLVPYSGAVTDLLMGTHDVTAMRMSMTEIFLSTTPPAVIPTTKGACYWDADADTWSLVLSDGVVLRLGSENYTSCIRDGSAPNPIVHGTPVYMTSVSGAKPQIDVARADTVAKMHVAGIATHDIATNGRISTFGLVRAVPQTVFPAGESWVAGDKLWLAPTGGMTNVEPTKPTPIVQVGLVLSVDGVTTFDMLVNIVHAHGVYSLYDVAGDAPDTTNQMLVWNNTLSYWTKSDALITLLSNSSVAGSILNLIKLNAQNADYDNAVSGLSAVTLKNAIDELDGFIDTLKASVATSGSVLNSIKIKAEEADLTDSENRYTAITIKGALAEIAGAGRTTETVKGNADAIATLNDTVGTVGSILKSIKDNAEDATFSPAEGSGITSETIENAVNEVGTDVEGLKTSKVAVSDIINDFTTGGTTKPASADTVKTLKGITDALDFRLWAIEAGILPLGALFEGMPSVVTGSRTLNNTGRTLRVNSGSMNADPYPQTDIRFQFPFNEIRTAKITADFQVVSWLDEPDFLDAEGIIAVRVPRAYIYLDEFYNLVLAKHKATGAICPPLFVDQTTGEERAFVWVGADKATKMVGQNKLDCQLLTPYYTSQREDTVLRPYAEAVGAGWSQGDIALRDYLQFLILIAGASWDTQTVFGRGVCDLRYTDTDRVTTASVTSNYVIVSDAVGALYNVNEWVNLGASQGSTSVFAQRLITLKETDFDSAGNTRITVDGATFTTAIANRLWHAPQLVSEANFMAMGNECGYIGTNGRVPVSFFGIYNLWGNVWEWCDGIFHVGDTVYYTYDPTKYTQIGATQPTLANFTEHPTKIPTTNGYCGQFAGSPAIPSTLTGGGSSTGVCDYYYYATGYGVFLVGGFLYNGSHVGFFFWYGSYVPSFSYWGIGSRLLGRP